MMRDDVYDEEADAVGVGVGAVSVLDFTDEVNDPNGYYARLKDGNETDAGTDVTHIRRPVESISSSLSSSSSSSSFGESARYGSDNGNCRLLMYIWWWAKLVLLVAALAVLGAVFLIWVGPFIMDKEIIPVINWETGTFNRAELAILVLASVALFPTLFLPSSPAMWVAGMTFGCGYGFLLTIAAVPIGVSLPYFVGSLFHHKIQGLLERYPKRAALIRLAGEGNRFDQFRAVSLIRISPFPYIIFNYCAVATGVEYLPYLLGSLAGMVPEIFLTLYTSGTGNSRGKKTSRRFRVASQSDSYFGDTTKRNPIPTTKNWSDGRRWRKAIGKAAEFILFFQLLLHAVSRLMS